MQVQASRRGDCNALQEWLQLQNASRVQLDKSLLAAAAWGHAEAVSLLLHAGADPCGAIDGAGASALHLAVRRGRVDAVQQLLLPQLREFNMEEARRRRLNFRDKDGATPLAESCQHQRPDLAAILLGAGADPNIACAFGRRPLHWAAIAGDRHLALLLLQSGADPAAADVHNRTAAMVAASMGHSHLAVELSRVWRPVEPRVLSSDVAVLNSPEQLTHFSPIQSNPAEAVMQVSTQVLSRFQHSQHPPQAAPQQWQSPWPNSHLPPQIALQQSQWPSPQLQVEHQPQRQQQISRWESQPQWLPSQQSQPLTRHQFEAATYTSPTISSIGSAVSGAKSLSKSQPASSLGSQIAVAPPKSMASSLRRFSDTAGPPTPPEPRWRASSCSIGTEAYPMESRPRGTCLVLNNERHLDPTGRLSDRLGSQKDAERIKQLFSKRLGFNVNLRNNLTGWQMREMLAEAAAENHEAANAFVCFLLCHGAAGGALYGTDEDLVPLAELTAALDVQHCPSLAGKPKIFFVQACRGSGEVVFAVHRLVPDGPLASPEGSDYLCGFACCEDQVAYRCPESGSVYVQTLCDEIEQRLAQRGFVDLEEALRETRLRITSADLRAGDAGKQVYMVPKEHTTLRFKVLLREFQ